MISNPQTAFSVLFFHYEVLQNGDRKWLVAYADVALNGVQRVLHDYSPEIGKHLTIYCYQPEPGYCACILAAEEK